MAIGYVSHSKVEFLISVKTMASSPVGGSISSSSFRKSESSGKEPRSCCQVVWNLFPDLRRRNRNHLLVLSELVFGNTWNSVDMRNQFEISNCTRNITYTVKKTVCGHKSSRFTDSCVLLRSIRFVLACQNGILTVRLCQNTHNVSNIGNIQLVPTNVNDGGTTPGQSIFLHGQFVSCCCTMGSGRTKGGRLILVDENTHFRVHGKKSGSQSVFNRPSNLISLSTKNESKLSSMPSRLCNGLISSLLFPEKLRYLSFGFFVKLLRWPAGMSISSLYDMLRIVKFLNIETVGIAESVNLLSFKLSTFRDFSKPKLSQLLTVIVEISETRLFGRSEAIAVGFLVLWVFVLVREDRPSNIPD
ncbi:hypothetical protein OGAPHI_006289 [Ogataea philodendri]|uniref:Uncharacterized protein n=1 Tax=Ogataea philodendri TaxID=1378263 RepID=A0A9P8NXJ9_9ASCO|nr:uncharacterized protein OGAPHI_006289 [Ogataea philodendri]KAH3662108.1 hypothetical protein OGAPHI_006289 [Ogataea philodendri]